MSEPTASKPLPALFRATALTAAAWGTAYFWTRLAMEWTGPRLAVGLAVTIGYGLVGVLALGDRIRSGADGVGLRLFPLRSLLAVVLLVPGLVLAMEVEALVRLIFGRTGGVGVFEWSRGLITGASGLPLVGSIVLFVVVVPAMSEWFFRGVVQRELVECLGRTRGLLTTSLLYAVAVAGTRSPFSSWLALVVAAFALGVLLGAVRITSGSVAAAALLHGGFNLVGVVAWMVSSTAPVPAFTAPGSSLPAMVLVPALVCVVIGSVLLWRDWKRLPA
jgi:membrane protease YdiL (CAAX protease family)